MKKKQYLILETISYGSLSLFFISLPLWVDPIDSLGYLFLFVITPLTIFLTYKNYKQIAEARDEDREYKPALDASTEEQISYYKRTIYLCLFAFPVLTLINVFDLNDLESNTEENVRLWEPISYVYEYFGYWSAVLTTPLLGIIAITVFLRKINTIKSR